MFIVKLNHGLCLIKSKHSQDNYSFESQVISQSDQNEYKFIHPDCFECEQFNKVHKSKQKMKKLLERTKNKEIKKIS